VSQQGADRFSVIHEDLQYLAGHLAHRSANTDNERTSAQYIAGRMRRFIPNTTVDDFYTAEAPWVIFGSYYGEFFIVSLLAIWWPKVALCYGAIVFLAHLAEVVGYRLLSRFMPQYESQNVVGHIMSTKPERTLIITTHYDSPMKTASDKSAGRLSTTVKAVMVCMAVVLITCALQVLDVGPSHALLVTRWTATVLLVGAAGFMMYASSLGEDSRGANDNASGVAALLQMAERLAAEPPQHADVYLVATGSNQCWMSGMRHFLESQEFDRESTYFLNIDTVGSGTLSYTTKLGFLQMMNCSKPMIEAAASVQLDQLKTAPLHLRTVWSDAIIPLGRGYPCMEITTSSRFAEDDPLTAVDEQSVMQAADFAEAILRKLDN